MRPPVGVFLRAGQEARLGQCTVDEAVFGIHDSRLRVGVRLFEDTCRSFVAGSKNPCHITFLVPRTSYLAPRYQLFHRRVVFQQLDGQIAGGVALVDVVISFEVLLDMAHTVFYLVTVVDMDMSRGAAGTLVHLDDMAEQLFHALARLERRGHHRHAEQGTQRREVHMVAATFKLVVHIQGAHHLDVHVDKLRRQVEVALQVAGVDNVDHHIGHLFHQVLPDI